MQIADRFGPIPVSTTLDASGNGTVVFQVNGKNARITTLFVKVATSVNQAVCTLYKGQVGDSNVIGNTNSGSTGAPAWGQIDLLDGETLYVVWRGGDVGATATATFVGVALPFDQIGAPYLQWSDPIAAGDGSLIYPALKSPNYVAGTVGWMIDRQGNAEFNNITVRGTFQTSSTNGSYVKIYSTPFGGSEIDLQPPDFTNPALSAAAATIQAISFNGSDPGSYLHFQAPSFADRDNIYLDLYSGDRISLNPLLDVRSPTANTVQFQLNGIPMGNGWVAGAGITASNAAVNATETVQLTAKDVTGNSFTYLPGHIYKVVVTGGATTSALTAAPLFRIRKTNAAGQQLDVWRAPCQIAAQTYPANYITYFQVGTTQVTADIVCTLVGTAGVAVQLTGAPTSPSTLNIYDDGLVGTPNGRQWVATLV